MTKIRTATEKDVPIILEFIRELAAYEKLEAEVIATEDKLKQSLFGKKSFAEVLILERDSAALGFALFFHSYSTFLAQPGIYLEDLYVRESERGQGYGKMLFTRLAQLTVERGCGRLEWSVLNWNEPAIKFYQSLGSQVQSEWHTHRLTGPALRSLIS